MPITKPFPVDGESPWGTKIREWADDVETEIAGLPGSIDAVVTSATAKGVGTIVGGASVKPLTSLAAIATYGDSIIYSNNGSLQEGLSIGLTGTPVSNNGQGGNTSTDVAIRYGAVIPLVTITGGVIPAATGYVPVTIKPTRDFRESGGSFSFSGTLAGVGGTLRYDMTAQSWSFSRGNAGAEIAVATDTPFIVSADAQADRTLVLMSGRNNLYAVEKNIAYVMRDTEAMVRRQTPYAPRAVILATLYSTDEGKSATGSNAINREKIRSLNSARASKYGSGAGGIVYFDINRAFIDNGLAIMGITPTSPDTAAIANDVPPPSLMADNIHPNRLGYIALGLLLAQFMATRSWGYLAPVVWASDSFDRADGAPGNTDSALGGTPRAWTANAVISGNALANTTGSGFPTATLPAVNDVGISAKIHSIPSAGTLNIRARYVDSSNYVYVGLDATGVVTLISRVSGVSTTLGFTSAGAATVGDRVELRCIGTTLEAVVNGTVVLSKQAPTPIAGTAVGFELRSGSGVNDVVVYDY